MIIQVRAPHFTAALWVEGGKCVKAAPILRWAIGKTWPFLAGYFARKGFATEEVVPNPAIHALVLSLNRLMRTRCDEHAETR